MFNEGICIRCVRSKLSCGFNLSQIMQAIVSSTGIRCVAQSHMGRICLSYWRMNIFATLFVSFCNPTFWWYSFLLLPQSMKEKDILRNAFAVPLLPLAELIQPSCCAYRACSFPPTVLPPHRLRVKVQDDAGSACDVWFCSAMVAIAFLKIRTIIDTIVTDMNKARI